MHTGGRVKEGEGTVSRKTSLMGQCWIEFMEASRMSLLKGTESSKKHL